MKKLFTVLPNIGRIEQSIFSDSIKVLGLDEGAFFLVQKGEDYDLCTEYNPSDLRIRHFIAYMDTII